MSSGDDEGRHRPVRLGMVGGGPGAFIGAVHRAAAALDGEFELVAGAFSADPGRSAAQGRELGLDPDRVYPSWQAMAEAETALDPAHRIEAVSVVTPNHLHHPVATAWLESGTHVICDKPLARTLDEAEDLCRAVARSDALFVLTHNYSGYPMVREARERVRSGNLGSVRKVVVEYAQGWLATRLESQGHKQAEWRLDPERAGSSSALADIGTHAEHLARYVTGSLVSELCADVGTAVPGRRMDDDAGVLLRFHGGARGVLIVSQVSVGEQNGLRLRVYGSEGSLAWDQESPDVLTVGYLDRPSERLVRGGPGLSDAARRATRLPSGHPEGFIEAFANLYRSAGRVIRAGADGRLPDPLDTDMPTVQDGARGLHFVQTALESARLRSWVDARYDPPGSA